jgi:hydrogenase maturation protease
MDALRNQNILVLGLGNTLLADDGVGVHVVRRLRADAQIPPWLRAVDGGTMGFRLTGLLGDEAGVLIIDAADFAAAPGSMRLLGAENLAAHIATGTRTSAHEAGLVDLLALLRLQDCAPRHLAVLAIQPGRVDWGEVLSAEVANAVGPACALAKTTVSAWWRG